MEPTTGAPTASNRATSRFTRRGAFGAGATGQVSSVRDPVGDGGSVASTADPPLEESGRLGHTVYYDPSNDPHYGDLQTAIGDVPAGGTLWLGQSTIDVATEGRIAPSKPMHVRGAGWTASETGTKLINTGGDAVDEPVIDVAPSSGEYKNVSVRGLEVVHSGSTTPAIRFSNAAKSLLESCRIRCWGVAPTGVQYEGEAYLARCFGNTVTGFTDYGVHVQSIDDDTNDPPYGGYGHELFHNHVQSGADDVVMCRTERKRTLVVGGKYIGGGSPGDGKTAIEFYNPLSSRAQEGGLVIEPGIRKVDNGIVVDGVKPFDNVQIYHATLPMPWNSGTGVHFKNARDCKLIRPIVPRSNGDEDLVHWHAASEHCSLITDPETPARVTYTNDGASNPHVHVVGSTPNSTLSNYQTGVPTTVTFNPDSGGPVLHTGSGGHWKKTSTSGYSALNS